MYIIYSEYHTCECPKRFHQAFVIHTGFAINKFIKHIIWRNPS